MFPLPIFPESHLVSSVITTVWIGVFVVCFFNLRLGWVLSGLVVPGYLVPLIILKPWSALIIVLEAILTYSIVWSASEFGSRTKIWAQIFGRDRFFAMVLVSIIVRTVMDVWLLPPFGLWLNDVYAINMDYRSNLHSFGLVIIALMANQFWKTGLLRGLIPLMVTVGVTFLIVRFVLLTLTNFTVSHLGYMYEDIAASVLASPKAYIILITVAFVASRMNLRYGWDFNGLLIPALLALQWFQPGKLLVSFLESFVVLGIAILILKLRIFQFSNIEGARKFLLFFNISFLYKIILGYVLMLLWPEFKVTDSYGFGYLLTTLMAVKMHELKVVGRMSRATLQTSIVGLVIASVIGFGLTFLPSHWQFEVQPEQVVDKKIIPSKTNLSTQLQRDQVRLYESKINQGMSLPLPSEVERFRFAIQAINAALLKGISPYDMVQIKHLFILDLQVLWLEGRYLYIRDEQPKRGWGIYVLDSETDNQLMVEVPMPLDEWGTIDAGHSLFFHLNGRALAIAGAQRKANLDLSSDVLLNRHTIFSTFHQVLKHHDVIQVRGYTRESSRILTGKLAPPTDIGLPDIDSQVWINGQIPATLNLTKLQQVIEHYDVKWGYTPFNNRIREISDNGFVEIYLNRSSIRKLMAAKTLIDKSIPLQVGERKIEGYLHQWLVDNKEQIARKGSNAYVLPTKADLLFFDENLLSPLVIILQQFDPNAPWSKTMQQTLRRVALNAAVFNYQLIQYQHRVSKQNYLILAEKENVAQRRHWGTYVFRVGESNPYVVQIPRPLFEISSFEYGIALFERLQAEALLIGGTHPDANTDGSADLVRVENKDNLFNLANQVVLREHYEQELMIVHSRAFGPKPDMPFPKHDILLAVNDGTRFYNHAHEQVKYLINQLEDDGLDVRIVDGSQETAGYEIGHIPQTLYLNQTQNKLFAITWVSPLARSGFRQQLNNNTQNSQFSALTIATEEVDLSRWVQAHLVPEKIEVLSDSVIELVRDYMQSQDIVLLSSIQQQSKKYELIRLIDINSKQAFLAFLTQTKALIAIANLEPRYVDETIKVDANDRANVAIDLYIAIRAAWLFPGSGK